MLGLDQNSFDPSGVCMFTREHVKGEKREWGGREGEREGWREGGTERHQAFILTAANIRHLTHLPPDILCSLQIGRAHV